MKKIVILGGGIGGLSVGWMLSRQGDFQVTVVEKAPVVGGVCGTFSHKGFLLDYGPHKIYSVLPGIMDEFKTLLGEEAVTIEKSNTIYLFKSYLRYPLHILDLFFKMGPINIVESAVSLLTCIFFRKKAKQGFESYEDYIIGRFGKKLYEIVFKPLAEKTWGEPSTLSADIAKTRIPSSHFLDVLVRLLGLKKENHTTDAKHFSYPKKGFGRIAERMAEEIIKNGGKILLNSYPIQINSEGPRIHSVVLNDNSAVECDTLISSIHLHSLLPLFDMKLPMNNGTIRNTEKLQYRDAFLVYLFTDKDRITKNHWIFFPSSDVVFGRVYEQKMLREEMCPPNKTVLCCDLTDYKDNVYSKLSDGELVARCIGDLEKVGLIKKQWVNDSLVKRIPEFYPRYDVNYKSIMKSIFNSLKKYDNLILTGRIGFYNYNNADHCLDMGKFIAENLTQGKPTSRIFSELELRVADYKIVD